jgi:tetrathionate reductase subunit B
MPQIYMIVDVDRCWGCKSCQVACKYEHGIPAGKVKPIEVFRIENKDVSGKVYCDYLPVMCQHCEKPECLDACPVSAISRNEEGVVVVDSKLCTGCGLCAESCPYDCITEEDGLAHKCDLCIERRSRGFPTSCEQHCMGRAFTSCTKEDMEALVAGRRYVWSTGRVVYVSDQLSGLGKAFGKA